MKTQPKEDDCIDMEIDREIEMLKILGFSKTSLINEISKIPNALDKLRHLRVKHYGELSLRDGLFLKPIVECNMRCYKPCHHGCPRYEKISSEIDDLPNCQYYGM